MSKTDSYNESHMHLSAGEYREGGTNHSWGPVFETSNQTTFAGCVGRPTAGILEASESIEFFRKIAN